MDEKNVTCLAKKGTEKSKNSSSLSNVPPIVQNILTGIVLALPVCRLTHQLAQRPALSGARSQPNAARVSLGSSGFETHQDVPLNVLGILKRLPNLEVSERCSQKEKRQFITCKTWHVRL